MKQVIQFTICAAIVIAAAPCFATAKRDSTTKTRKPGTTPMGLMEASVGFGSMKLTQEGYTPKKSVMSPESRSNSTTNNTYGVFHFQESLLCNYFWADKDDKKVKFGFQETIDLGYGRGPTVSTTTVAGTSSPEERTVKGRLLFSYQAALAGVYKVNEDIDAGLTYYFFVSSDFTPNKRYAKFRARYTHFMAEVSAFGKSAIDLKYTRDIPGSYETASYFIGISYINNTDDKYFGTDGEYNKHNEKFMQINIGIML
jgi:hypothetical protein